MTEFNEGWWNCFCSFVNELANVSSNADMVIRAVLDGAGVTKKEIDDIIKSQHLDKRVIEELKVNHVQHPWSVMHIIDGAMAGDTDKVKRYARRLADTYIKDDDQKFADCILSAIGEKKVAMATMDGDEKKMKVITLCGSTRFKEQFLEQQKRLTLEGNVVVSVGLFGHSGDEEVWKPGMKEMLDKMHLQKIDMADEIFVINVGGYIGESTKREIAYAESLGKKVNFLEG